MTLGVNVLVDNRWYGPDYLDAGDPPWDRVGPHLGGSLGDGDGRMPDLDELDPDDPSLDDGTSGPVVPAGPPPKSGRGSSAGAWRDYARANGVEVADDADRDDVIAACVEAGVPTDD